MRRRRGAPPRAPCCVTRSQSRMNRLNALPDDVLLRVLARLGCVRTAARTGVLSRRWRGLWTGLDEVAIRGLAPDAIHAALAQLERPAVSALDIHVSMRRHVLHAAGVSSLLYAAAGRSPGKLTVTIPGLSNDRDVAVDLPRLDSSTSVKLDVPGVFFVLPPATELPVLETLSLSACAMDLATLVPRCPKLRVLIVTKTPPALNNIKVHSASLQELIMSTLEQSAIDIAAPVLKKLTLSCNMGTDGSLSVVAPMVEEVSLRCWYYSMYVELFSEMWRVCFLGIRKMEIKEQGKLSNDEGSGTPVLPPAHILSLHILLSAHHSQRNFAQEMEKLPVTVVSVLELKIGTSGHVFGPMVLYLLGIYTAVQKLNMVLLEPWGNVEDSCFRRCHCEEPNKDWRDQTISLTSLTEVEIKGFRGENDEVDFLGLLFRCAPMLQTMTVKLCDEVIPGDDWYNRILDTFKEYPSVNSNICL